MKDYCVKEFKLSKTDHLQRKLEMAEMKVANEIWGPRVIDIKVKDENDCILVTYYIEGEDEWG